MSSEIIYNTLREIGFTEGEAKIYISLLVLGESKVGPIIKHSNISRSKVYDILGRLSVKGVVGKIDKNGIAYFRAFDSTSILNTIKEKRRKLEEEERKIKKILPELNSIGSTEDVKVIVYEGFGGFKAVIDDTVKNLKKSDTYRVIGGETNEAMRSYAIKIYDSQKTIKFKAESIFDQTGASKLKERKTPMHKGKVLPKGWNTPALFTTYADNVGIHMGSDEKIISILIKSKEVAETINSSFQALWKIAK